MLHRPRLEFVTADARKLPFDDCSFDVYTIAFGIRNVTVIEEALAEARRVLRPGGRFLCLEFSHVTNPLLAAVPPVVSSVESVSRSTAPSARAWSSSCLSTRNERASRSR